MCFSPQASFTAGTALSVVGVATVVKAVKDKKKKEIPFAAIPLLFAVQQITEGFVWLTLIDYQWPLVQATATYIFSFFAFVWWPIFIPIAIGLMEAVIWRKRIITGLWFVGLAAGGYLLYNIAAYPVFAHVINSCIAYRIESPVGIRPYSIALYIIAALGPCYISSRKIVNLFGATATISLIVTYLFFRIAFVSVWCFFAAILSAIIYFYFYRRKGSMLAVSTSAD